MNATLSKLQVLFNNAIQPLSAVSDHWALAALYNPPDCCNSIGRYRTLGRRLSAVVSDTTLVGVVIRPMVNSSKHISLYTQNDIALHAPTWKAMQKFIRTLDACVVDIELACNANKTV
jgi:hypothetical protein